MREEIGDIWELAKGRGMCVTTNPIINAKSECVMGRGIALQTKTLFPVLPIALAARIRAEGNVPFDLGLWVHDTSVYRIFSLPTKYDWREKSDPSLIRRSLMKLSTIVEDSGLTVPVYLPRPGCGNGKLNWRDIKPFCAELLSDQFVVVEYQPSQPELDLDSGNR